jgi:catechol 2,3-dioxygenase-like lactoylglutathione lyase family enzyme
MQLAGFHHVTAVTADLTSNHAFYVRKLGRRLVKKSVNQDDVSAYHLFYGDGEGTPGTELTFFDWRLPHEHRGNCSAVSTGPNGVLFEIATGESGFAADEALKALGSGSHSRRFWSPSGRDRSRAHTALVGCRTTEIELSAKTRNVSV